MSQSSDFKRLYVRDLQRLKSEIEQYSDEELLWAKKGDINNPSGNLALHICGNLQHFIGATLLRTSYIRDREFEFNGRVTKSELIAEIEETIGVIEKYFELDDDSKYQEPYPVEVFGYPMTVFNFLVHLQGHLNYHLGQINYHRRLIGAN